MELTQWEIFLENSIMIFGEIINAIINILARLFILIKDAWAITIPIVSCVIIGIWLLRKIKPPRAKVKIDPTDPEDPQPPT